MIENALFFRLKYFPFLPDPSPIIGNACHLLTHSVLFAKHVTMAFEDANSKLVEVVSVSDLDAENHFDDRWVKILKLKFR